MTNKFTMKQQDKRRHSKKSLFNRISIKVPNFGAMLFGFLLGIFTSCLVVFMFATSDITLKLPTIGSKKPLQIASNNKNIAKEQAKSIQEPRFDFYTELAKNEPERTLDLKRDTKTIHGYIVQAGTYKKAADADAVRARLTLNGIAAKIDHVKYGNGELLHRVLLGTFKNEQQAKALQQRLKTLEIESVLVLKYTE